jgi:hypothetical protein
LRTQKKPVSVDLQAFTSFCFSSQQREGLVRSHKATIASLLMITQ